MLRKENWNDAGGAGLAGFFRGMRVRLSAKISASERIVKETCGTVIGFAFHPEEFEDPQDDWMSNMDHPAWRRGWVVLRYMPLGVYVKIDGRTVGDGFGSGVFLLQPRHSDKRWDMTVNRDRAAGTREVVQVRRLQIPLLHEKVCTTVASQGKSMDWESAFLAKSEHMKPYEHWLNVYVMMSRARMLRHLLAWELPEWKVV